MTVDRDGKVTTRGDKRALYATMSVTRVSIILAASRYSVPALLTALRYSTVRRQFQSVSGVKKETQLIDYQTQQQKLFPILATSMAHRFVGFQIRKLFKQMEEQVSQGNFGMLDLTHHLSSGMKSVFSQDTMDNLLIIRQSIGGAGFTAWSGLPDIIQRYAATVTLEGDNTVMVMQCCNFILKLA